MRKRELIALLLLSLGCIVTVNVLWLFLTVQWLGLQCVIEAFPDHTHYLRCQVIILKIYCILLSEELFYLYKQCRTKLCCILSGSSLFVLGVQ